MPCYHKKLLNKRFGKLIVIDQIPVAKCICVCDCGNKKIITSGNLRSGHSTSCGCISSVNRKSYTDEIKEKIKKNIKINEHGCWIWQKSLSKQNYGQICYNRKVNLVHRISYILFKGEIPDNMYVCHNCPVKDNPSCCNPDHLFLGSNSDNILDAFNKGYKSIHGENHYHSKLKDEDIVKIRGLYRDGHTKTEISRLFGVTDSHINLIVKRKAWKHVL